MTQELDFQPLIGLQLYTLNPDLESDFEGTLRAVAAAGTEAVEFPAEPTMAAAELKQLLASLGLKAAGIVYGWEDLLKAGGVESAIAYLKECGAAYAMNPWIGEEKRGNVEDYRAAAKQLEDWGKQFHAAGIPFLYHFHGYEFSTIPGSELTGEAVLAETDPTFLKFQLDTYWALVNGCDPLDFFRKYAGRIPSIHCKDLNNAETGNEVEAGSGIIEFETLFKLALQEKVQWLLIEQEAFERPRIESVQIATGQLKTILKQALAS